LREIGTLARPLDRWTSTLARNRETATTVDRVSLVRYLLAAPRAVAGLLLVAFLMFFALLALTLLAFRRHRPACAMALGLMVSQRNMGLMIAPTGGLLPGIIRL